MKEVVIDLRTQEEYAKGHLEESINIPHTEFIEQAKQGLLDTDTKYLLHCRSGGRVGVVMQEVSGLQLENVQERFNAYAAEHPESL